MISEAIQEKLANLFLKQFQLKYKNKESLLKLKYEMGIDQAGRGAVLGSMIYAGLWWPIQIKEKLTSLGFDDSKKLTKKKRQELFKILAYLKDRAVFFQTKQLTATFISNSSYCQPKLNLNTISHNAALELIKRALDQGFNIKHIYIDTVGNPEKYQKYLWKNLKAYKCIEQIIVIPKADSIYKVVSAASICAKVQRDKILKEWKFPENIKFQGQLGSGYPNKKTKKWLQKNKHEVFGYPNLVRFSWSTSQNKLKNFVVLQILQQQQKQQREGLNYIRKQYQSINKDIFSMFPN